MHPAPRTSSTSSWTSRPGPWVDIHCHCLPGLDDGPVSQTEALALARALVADGIHTVIATPHQLGYYDGTCSPQTIRDAVTTFNNALTREQIPLTVLPGADVRIDERLPQLLDTDQVLTLASSRYLLLELPHEIYLDPIRIIPELSQRSLRAVISHPERQSHLARWPHLVEPWFEHGALLQLTAAGLLGHFGSQAQTVAWHWLSHGKAAFVATDAHDILRRKPRMRSAAGLIAQRLGPAVARRVCRENPTCVLNDQDIPVSIPSLNESIST